MKKSYAKQKLMSAAAMLGVSVMMLSSASFAWFSVATTDTVTGIKSQMKANQNIEIALDAGSKTSPAASAPGDATAQNKNNTWGATVDLTSDTATGNLGPASPKSTAEGTAGSELKVVQYAADGRPTSLVTATESSGVFQDGDGNDVGIYKDIWIRTNVAGNIQLQIGDITGLSDTLKAKARVGVQTLGTATADATAATTAVGNITEVTVGAASATTVISGATANTSYLLRVLVYLDGWSLTNADMGTAVSTVTLGDLTFTNSAITSGTNSYTNTANVPTTQGN